jgi:hypothetical protein
MQRGSFSISPFDWAKISIMGALVISLLPSFRYVKKYGNEEKSQAQNKEELRKPTT